MNDVERLAVEQAVYNAIGADLKTGVPDNLRGRVNDQYRQLYELTGATGFEVRVNGQKVGTFGFNKVKGQPERTVTELRVTDEAALRADTSEEFAAWLKAAIKRDLPQYALAYAEETGELLDGMDYVTITEPATPDGIRPNGTLRVHPEKVAAALGGALPIAIAGMLEGGE